MKFLIGFNCNGYPIEMSGGMTVIRKLAKDLVKLGYLVFVIDKQFNVNGTILISEAQASNLGFNDLITIYPEITKGNPLNSKNVVRWILYNTRPEIEETWSSSDFYFYFSEFFNTTRIEDKKILTCVDFKLDLFCDKNQQREGYCHIARYHKVNIPDYLLKEKYNSEDLFKGHMQNGWEWLVNKLNTKKYFITYDQATYYSVIAAMCGCISIILNHDDDKKYKKEIPPSHKYGIAYGFEEIDSSIKTRKLIKPYLKKMENDSIKTVKNFVSFFKNKI